MDHLPAQPEPSLGGGLVERISDGEPTARQVPDTTLDSQLMEGITYLEHLALGVSLDSGPMEGTSCLEPLEQSILQSSWIARPRNGVIKEKTEWLYPGQSTYGGDNLPGASSSGGVPGQWTYGGGVVSGATGAVGSGFVVSCTTCWMCYRVEIKTSHWKPVIHPVMDINTDDLHMKKFPYPVPLEQSVLGVLSGIRTNETDRIKCPSRTSQLYYEQSGLQSSMMSETDIVNQTDVSDDMNTDLPESSAPMLKSPTIFERPYVNSSALPTLNPGIVNQTDVTLDLDTDPPENSAPMITSDLMIVDWEDIFCSRPRYCGKDLHGMMDTVSSEPDVRK